MKIFSYPNKTFSHINPLYFGTVVMGLRNTSKPIYPNLIPYYEANQGCFSTRFQNVLLFQFPCLTIALKINLISVVTDKINHVMLGVEGHLTKHFDLGTSSIRRQSLISCKIINCLCRHFPHTSMKLSTHSKACVNRLRLLLFQLKSGHDQM